MRLIKSMVIKAWWIAVPPALRMDLRLLNVPAVMQKIVPQQDEVVQHLWELPEVVLHTVPTEKTVPQHLVHFIALEICMGLHRVLHWNSLH